MTNATVVILEDDPELQALLERRLPGARVCVVHDTRLVLAAAGLDAGIALIAGTGVLNFCAARWLRASRLDV